MTLLRQLALLLVGVGVLGLVLSWVGLIAAQGAMTLLTWGVVLAAVLLIIEFLTGRRIL